MMTSGSRLTGKKRKRKGEEKAVRAGAGPTAYSIRRAERRALGALLACWAEPAWFGPAARNIFFVCFCETETVLLFLL
jgi:hypothetical protein